MEEWLGLDKIWKIKKKKKVNSFFQKTYINSREKIIKDL